MNHDLDQLYIDWMAAEDHERACLLMLGARDDVAVRALAEQASECRAALERDYRDALAEAGLSDSLPAAAANS